MKVTHKTRKTKWGRLNRRHLRIRKRVSGTAEIPRVMVRKTLKHLYAMVIDDSPETGSMTLLSVSTLKPGRDVKKGYCNIENAKKLGAEVGAAIKEKGIEKIVFDRGGFPYHGRIKAVAEAMREAGVKF